MSFSTRPGGNWFWKAPTISTRLMESMPKIRLEVLVETQHFRGITRALADEIEQYFGQFLAA